MSVIKNSTIIKQLFYDYFNTNFQYYILYMKDYNFALHLLKIKSI